MRPFVASTMLPPPPIVSATAALNWLSTAAQTNGIGSSSDALPASMIRSLSLTVSPGKCINGVASATNIR